MINKNYSIAIAETLDILDHMNREDVKKISPKFMYFLKINKAKDYKPNLDHSKSIKEMNLKKETIGLLSIIYKMFWCSEEEREEFNKKIIENSKKS